MTIRRSPTPQPTGSATRRLSIWPRGEWLRATPWGSAPPTRLSLWLGILGAWKAGALPGLLDAQLSAEALPYFVDDVNAPVVAAASERHEVLRAAGARSVIDLDELVHRTAPADGSAAAPAAAAPATPADGSAAAPAAAAPAAPDNHGPDAPLYLSYTSGTTGRPQGRGAALGGGDPGRVVHRRPSRAAPPRRAAGHDPDPQQLPVGRRLHGRRCTPAPRSPWWRAGPSPRCGRWPGPPGPRCWSPTR